MENLVYAKPFVATSMIKAKPPTTPDGPWIVSGPIGPEDEGEDFDKDILTKAGILSGLPMFTKLGSQVDFAHQWRQTKNLNFIIGKGVPTRGPNDHPYLDTTLFKSKPPAQQLWLHLQEPDATAGYSMEGLCKARDPKAPKRIIETEIHMVTVDPQPKGFGNFLRVGPTQSLQAIAKSVMADLEGGADLADAGWMAIPADLNPALVPLFLTDFDYAERLMKSVVSASRIFKAGWTDLHKAASPAAGSDQPRCPACGCHNRASRTECRKCGAAMGVKKAIDKRVGANVTMDFDAPPETPTPSPATKPKKRKPRAFTLDDDRDYPQIRPATSSAYRKDVQRRINAQKLHNADAPVTKAFTTGSAIVGDGATGGQSLRKQALVGSKTTGRKRRRRKPGIIPAGPDLWKAYVGFDKLKAKLSGKGVRDAGAVAAAIGNKKYSRRRMQQAAASHRTLRGAKPA